MLVSLQQLKKETNHHPATTLSDNLTKVFIPEEVKEAGAEKPLLNAITEGNVISKKENQELRKEMIAAKGFEPLDFAYERAIGENDSLYSNFTELIMLTKRKVCRIVIKENDKRIGFATGFMVSPVLMLTNWHVFQTRELAAGSEAHFFYEYDVQGHPLPPVIFRFDVATFFDNDEELDYCFVAVQPTDVSGTTSLKKMGYIFLDKGLGKIGDKGLEKLNIIHHPLGDYKQISIRQNTFAGIDATKILYLTDTAPGSSGSPVFNDQWQVVGLHHKSIPKMSADGKNYLDKNDKVIPVIEDKIDMARIVWKQNEGIRISVIVNHLTAKNPANKTVAALAVAPLNEDLNSDTTQTSQSTTMTNNTINTITITVPTEALSNEKSIDISLFTKPINVTTTLTNEAKRKTTTDELLLEIAKADKEQEVDFSKCRGYDPDFLGVDVPLPGPKKTIEKQIARLKTNRLELKYFKYSVIFNAVKKMPLLSAINVEGDAAKRLDDSTRDDDWLRDKRIDLECQLTDKYYRGSKLDKGHMGRWEDANWDDTEALALRNGIYTCFYTNACPQVEALNRAGGLWGKLEKEVLEKGIKKQAGKLARMTVFNGPIFNEAKDRVRQGVIIPMEFFKIIVWLNDAMEVKATAFKLSQETLVDDVTFDELLNLDAEALDIDKNITFKNYQCSIKSLSTDTKIDFKGLEKFDTFKVQNGNHEVMLEKAEAIQL